MWWGQEKSIVAVWNSGTLWGIQVKVTDWHLDLDLALRGVGGMEFGLA